ncbi:cache domain-containing protein [Methanogenium marinum]|uniref:Cache domain-containing protein n=1 Tax=Methanogenium marinum TaxID=348610 RepID=A0A9Q4KQH3_9EURY|nr:cache domain-containing protein [Methanogenium marinum]MDE4908673.1 cache domain-containing protein [Methanogenium marinum]
MAVTFAGCTSQQEKKVYNTSSMADLAEYVQDAAGYVETAGAEAALEEFNAKGGRFKQGDWYVYAYDYSGILRAHPYERDVVGTDRGNWTDARGLSVIRIAQETAANGGGYIAYLYPSPTGGDINESAGETYVPKIGYSYPAESDLWVGSGMYFNDITEDGKEGYPVAITKMISLVEAGAAYAGANGTDVALAEIGNVSGQFMDENGHYLYAYDYNGTLVAHPYLGDRVGNNLIDRTGPFGMENIRALSETAEDGGGFVVFVWPNPDNDNLEEIKIGYVLPVNDEWWLGSGVYLSEITGEGSTLFVR